MDKIKKIPKISMGHNLITDYVLYDGDEYSVLCDSKCINKKCKRNKDNKYFKKVKDADGIQIRDLTMLCVSSILEESK